MASGQINVKLHGVYFFRNSRYSVTIIYKCNNFKNSYNGMSRKVTITL